MDYKYSMPILIPVEPEVFWESIRKIVREEIEKIEKNVKPSPSDFETPGLIQKPLYKIDEVCRLFSITKPTVYDWIKHGKLKPFKIRSRVYFLHSDIQKLLP